MSLLSMIYYQEEIILIKILRRAVKDYSNKRYMSIKEQKEDVLGFFKSQNFSNILKVLAINEEDFFDSFKTWKEVND